MKLPKPNNLILGNQDIDTSLITLEMTGKGVLDPQVKTFVGLPAPTMYTEIVKGDKISVYMEQDKLKLFVSKCWKTFLENPEVLDELKKKSEKVANEMLKFTKEKIDVINNLNKEELLEVLNKIDKLQTECALYGSAVAFADIFGDLTNKSTKIISEKKKLKYPRHVYSNVLSKPEPSYSEKAIQDICSSKKTDEELTKEYFWLNQGYIGRGLTVKELEHIRSNIDSEENHNISKEELLKELDLTESETNLFEVLKDLAYVKSLRADMRQALHVITNRIVDRFSSMWNIETKYLEALTLKELSAMILGEPKLPEKIKERIEHSLFLIGVDDEDMIYGKDVDEFLDKYLIKENTKNLSEIGGQIACAGKAKGIVKLVFGPQHLGKVEKGDILISVTTSPQLLPAMVKAAAFVTDIGGITSHAAIVAREFGKPCIVGTRHATNIFRDGDLVEVDAEKGTVKKLNK